MRLSLCPASAAPSRTPSRKRAATDQMTTLGVAAAISTPIGYLGYLMLENIDMAVIGGLLSLATLLGLFSESSVKHH